MGQKFIFKSYVHYMHASTVYTDYHTCFSKYIGTCVDVAGVECVEGSWAGELYCHNDWWDRLVLNSKGLTSLSRIVITCMLITNKFGISQVFFALNQRTISVVKCMSYLTHWFIVHEYNCMTLSFNYCLIQLYIYIYITWENSSYELHPTPVPVPATVCRKVLVFAVRASTRKSMQDCGDMTVTDVRCQSMS